MEERAASTFMRSYGKYIITLFLFIVVGYVLFYLTYKDVKREMIEGLNARQLIHAKQAARGIETFFNDHTEILLAMAKNEHIVSLDETGKRMMRETQLSHKAEVSIISRIDSRGRILHAEPYDRRVIGQPVTKMESFLKARHTHQITVSDVFTNRRGFQSIIVHAPVFRRGSFDGTLALIFPFDFIAKRYIEDIRIGKDGYVWMVSRNGIELSCPVPGHVGNSVFENCREFPDILAMAERMIRGEQGVTTYLFDRIRGDAVSKTTKHAVFMPIHVGDNFWSIVVATPEDEVMDTLSGFRDTLLLIAILFVIGIGFFLYMLIKTRIVVKEAERRRKAEEALRASETFLNSIIENSPTAMWISDPRGTLVRLNQACRDLLHITDDEVMGKYNVLQDTAVIEQGHLPLVKQVFEQGTTAKFIIEYDSVRLKNLDLREHVSVVLDVTISPVLDANRRVTYAIIQHIDITDRKRAEEERKVLEEHLQRAEKMEALGTLAGGVAHDLNNVLGIVVGYAEMLLMDADESDPIRPGLVNIMNGGQRAAAIVEDLLTLARRGVPGRNVLNLNRIIADCQKSPEFENLSLHHPSVKIKTDIDPDLLNISGSSVHIGKTLYNLLSNASEAMAKGGIVTITTSNQYLDKPIQGYDKIREGDYVVLSVSDTGEGISANDLKRIFEPFYTKKVMGRSGTGLGLAVVWGTVKDHHGYINVESEEGRGTTFTLYFPVTREDISAEAVAVAISEYMGSGESILVVDDVKEQRDLAAGMLRTLNYNVSSVSSGEEAVAYLKEHKVDLMVLDMIMDPGMDGLDTYRSILEIHPEQKAIIVSGFSESDRVHDVQALGAGAYVRKPYVIEKLGLAVRNEQRRRVG